MYALTLSAELEGVTNLRPKDTQESNFFYTFKVQCTSCRETHPNPIAVNRFRESSATIKAAPNPYQQTEPAKAQKIIEFDCRGLEFTEFLPEGEWLADGIESNTKFDGVELSEGEWFDYDEKAGDEMTPAELTATLGFLTDAGHLLATAAPETSAYVMSQRNGLMLEHEMALTDKQRQHVCSCCGHIMLLGQGSELQVKAGQRASQKPRSTRAPKGNGAQKLPSRPQTCPGPTKAITCGHCGRLTNVKLPAPAPISRRKVKVEKATKASGRATSVPSTAQEMASQKTTSNASSKKRAKSRKAGLQALLDQSNASRNSGPGLGLSLADFMQR
ncbi:putative UPF0587 protein [Parachaetomium inaequale]|uniref:UPF0587 protein n=1 Tax=Parachaetomium inaequale TaxID=2588326 RepID=A0AAN6PQQ4_9PEZI|nr:putative UPF0587 protein [Parachaetomium inaequale]